ncbi:alpha/beta hydrolase [Actinosynnema sp. NPDC023587]|uniref:alpha/beta hydrolase n=1 Tax=Actinosynnema sp. NPDC023587 TaxID=3154695 RepID=UPI0033F250F1
MRKVVVAVSAVALVATLPVPAQAGEQDQRTPLHAQRLTWAPCDDIPEPTLECSTYTAPQDWRSPRDGKTITIAISRLKPKPGGTRGSVVTNPGGPGAPGRILPLHFQTRSRLVDNFEIIGVDPRGVGASTNLTCANADSLTVTDPRDRSRENVKLIYDAAERHAAACQRHSGEFGKVVNTEQTVKDYDLLRHLLGRNKISWIGYSGGTWTGAHYATYFPHRVDKFVFDSNTDFTTTFQNSSAEFGPGFERRFRVDFLPWAAKYHSLYGLGTTAEQVRQKYEETRAKLVKSPVQRPDGTVFNGVMLDLLLIQGLYSKNNFPYTAQTFSELAQTATAPAATAAAPVVQYPDAASATAFAISCNDTKFSGGRDHLAREAERLGRQYPLAGWYQTTAPCAFWKRPPLQLKAPTGKGVPPVLMVQSARDPATPLEGAQRAHRKFANSRMLTVTDEGDHGVYAFGNPCVDDVVESFIVDGKIPRKDSTCPGIPLPDPTSQTQAKTSLIANHF